LGPQSRLPILNPADLLRTFGSAPGALLCVPANNRVALAGPLRAARDCDAPLGLRCPWPLPDRDTPGRFFEAVRAAADELSHRRPLFLEAGPISIAGVDEITLAKATAQAFTFVDAGFGSVSLDASTLEPEEAAEAYRQVSQPAQERELSVEVAAPVVGGRANPAALGQLLGALRSLAVPIRFVRAGSDAFGIQSPSSSDWELDGPLLQDWHQAVAAFGVQACVEEQGTLTARWAGGWVGAGVRKVVAARPRDGAPDRVEALWYSETAELLAVLGAEGSGARSLAFLAENAEE
jgi:hypothetical protein